MVKPKKQPLQIQRRKRKSAGAPSTPRIKRVRSRPSPDVVDPIVSPNLSRLESALSGCPPEPSEVGAALSLYERKVDVRLKSVLPPSTKIPNTEIIQRAKEVLARWRLSLQPDTVVSAPDYEDEYETENETYRWIKAYSATILTRLDEGSIQLGDSSVEKKKRYMLREGESAILVHYDTFPLWQKQWFMIDNELIVPAKSHDLSVEMLKSFLMITDEDDPVPLPLADDKPPTPTKEDPTPPTNNITPPKDQRQMPQAKNTPPPVKVKVKETPIKPKYKASSTPKKSLKKVKEDENLSFTWICTNCNEAECQINPSSPLLLCDGPCKRPFHHPCTNLTSIPSSDQTWECPDCLSKIHPCGICNEYGKDGDEVFLCDVRSCGMFYHEGCLSGLVEMKSEGKLQCPAHQCWTCTQGEEAWGGTKNNHSAFREKNEKMLYRCMVCPNAYHLSCIPPLARFHELALLCHEHTQHKLPDLNMEDSLQKQLEDEAEQKILAYRAKTGKRVIERRELMDKKPNAHKSCFPKISWDSKPYRLPLDFQNEVHAKPPSYRYIHTNRYSAKNRPRSVKYQAEPCTCVDICVENCLNAMMDMECNDQNCNLGPDCGNRRLLRRQYPKSRPMREAGKGWGLMAQQSISKGDLVQEYVGEVISEEEMQIRLKSWSIENPGNMDYYIMKLLTGWYIDARRKGNTSRFINHSCEPNCVLIPMNCSGLMRIGIFSLHGIAPGEFLNYDYRFDTRDEEKFTCRCGAPKCRGTMKGAKRNKNGTEVMKIITKEGEKEEKKQTLKKQRIKYEKDLKYLESIKRGVKKRLYTVTNVIPGGEKSELVSMGCRQRDRERLRLGRVFLWRNAVLGSYFDERLRKWKKKKPKKTTVLTNVRHVDVISLIQKGLGKG